MALAISLILTVICLILVIIYSPRHTAAKGQIEVRTEHTAPYEVILQGNDFPKEGENS